MKKCIAKLVVTLSIGFMICSFCSEVNAKESNTGAMLNDPFVQSNSQKVINFESRLDESGGLGELDKNDKKMGDPDGVFYCIKVVSNKQNTNYYCGPAAVRQSLSFHKFQSGSNIELPSQETLAAQIGTTVNGSTTTGIVNGLNLYAYIYGFSSNQYVAGTIKNSSNPMNTFTSRIITDLKGKMKAPIILLQTKYLPRYNGKDCRHYNTVCGYSHEYSTGAKSMQTVDPHYSQLYYGTWWSPLGTFSGNGLFKAVYEADKAGSNMAMAY